MENPKKPKSTEHSVEYVTLRDYIDTRFAAVEASTRIAYATLEKRLEAMNEIRDTMRDQAGLFLTRAEYAASKEKIDADIRILREFKSMLDGKATQSSMMVTLIISVCGLILGITSLIINLFS